MSRFAKGFATVVAANVEVAMITLAGCVRPFDDLTKSARELVGKKKQ